MVSPFAMHQQQLAMLAQQQSLLMAAAAAGGAVKIPVNAQQGPNGANMVNQNWPNLGYQFPGVMMPAAGKTEPEKYMQVEHEYYLSREEKNYTWISNFVIDLLSLRLCSKLFILLLN